MFRFCAGARVLSGIEAATATEIEVEVEVESVEGRVAVLRAGR